MGSDAELALALDRASWWNTSRRNRLVIRLAPGLYRQRVELLDGVDLTGSAEIVWDGAGDTILTHGADSTLSGLTVRHVGPHVAYAIHADAPCRKSTLTLRGVTASSESKSALGVGLEGGQMLVASDCTFESNGTAVYIHPWQAQAAPIVANFTNCTALGGAVGVSWLQLKSNQRDELHWDGPIYAPTPFEADVPPPVLSMA